MAEQDCSALNSNIFENVSYFVSGNVSEHVLQILCAGGGKQLKYFSDFISHVICGVGARESDLSDADLYEVPAVTERWVTSCLRARRLLNTKGYLFNAKNIFSAAVVSTSGISKHDQNAIWAIVNYYGGAFKRHLDASVTHLVCTTLTSAKAQKCGAFANDVVVVTPDWLTESIKAKRMVGHEMYHPRLMIGHKGVASPTMTIRKAAADEATDEEDALKAKKEKLEALWKEMPWNKYSGGGYSTRPPSHSQPETGLKSFVEKQYQQQHLLGQQHKPTQMKTIDGIKPLPEAISPSSKSHQVQIIGQGQVPTGQGRVLLQQQQQQQQQTQQLIQMQQHQKLQFVNMHPQQQQQMQMQQQAQQQLQHLQLQDGQQQQQILLNQQQQFQQVPQSPTTQQSLQLQQQQQQQLIQQQTLMLHQSQHSPIQQQQQQIIQQHGVQQNIPQPQQQYQSQLQYAPQQQQQQQIQMLPPQQQIAHSPSIQQQQQHILQQQQSLLQQQHAKAQQMQQQNNVPQQQQQQQQAKQNILLSPPSASQQQQHLIPTPQQQQLQTAQNNLLLSPQHQQQQSIQQVVMSQQHQPPMPNLVMSQQNLMIQGQQQGPAQQFSKVPFSPQSGGQQQQQQQFVKAPQAVFQQQQQQQFAQPQTGGGAPVWSQQVIRPPVGARPPWPPGQHPPMQRQYIQLDAQTHQQLQNMAPEERAQFVEKLRKHRQLAQRQQQFIQLQQQRGGHILIRSNAPVPQGLTPQQQMQWLQQAKQQGGVVLQQQLPPQQLPTPVPQQQQAQTPPTQGLSPPGPFEQCQPPIRPPLRVHQLQLQRDQAKQQQQQQLQQQPQTVSSSTPTGGGPQPPPTNPTTQMDATTQPTRAKAALANMLSIRLSGGQTIAGEPNLTEHSAAGTLRLMTAQHNAAINNTATPNRTQQILALHQQRRMSAAAAASAGNADQIRPPPANQQTPNTPTPLSAGGGGGGDVPGKVPNSPRSVMPMQHRPGVFYGHNPNLKLPQNLFMLGCIFVVVEIGEQLDVSMPSWMKAVELFGGEIEKQYCSRVTHVLCESQRHGVVMQALRDYKRCVTMFWLRDVLERRQVLPPWMALHLPAMNLDSHPASKHLISLTGFKNDDRERIKLMVRAIGATLTTYFSQHNTLLVSMAPASAKHTRAKKWSVPVVNAQWLTDVMLGNFGALHQTEHVKYQQYVSADGAPHFGFDAALVANVMQGWKMPINISQESYERVKRSASPAAQPKSKKIKVEEGGECDGGSTTTELIGSLRNEHLLPQSTTHCIMLSSRCERSKELQEIIVQLGGSVTKSAGAATHFVANRLLLTMNLLVGISRELRFVTETWLLESKKANGFLDEMAYASDAKEFNQKYSCDFHLTMATANRRRLFNGRSFYITPSVYDRPLLSKLIEMCGGNVERVRRPLSRIDDSQMNAPFTYVIIANVDDLHLVGDIYKRRSNKTVCGKEIIISAVLKQTFEVEPYLIKANARIEE